MMKKQRLLVIVIVVLVGAGAMMAMQYALGSAAFITMQRLSPTLKPAEEIIFASVIRLEDLPKGWQSGRVQVENSPGVEGRYFRFLGTNDPSLTWVNVGEELFVFTGVEAAKQGYIEQSTKYFPPSAADDWKHIPELDFSHSADEIKVACLPGYTKCLVKLDFIFSA